MEPNPRQIRAFLAVVRWGGFTRAANELHLSQPALTVQIRQLEEILGIRLFDRDKRQVHLTQAGRSLLGPLERILADLERVVAESRSMTNLQRGRITLAILPSLAASLLPHVLRHFHAGYPGIEVRIHDVVGEQIVHMVKNEEVDFGLGSRLTLDRAVAFEPLLTDRMCVFFPEGHPLEKGAAPTLAQLAPHPLILTARNSSVRVLFERSLARVGVEVQIAAEANYMSTALGMVRAGLGVAILPASAGEAGSIAGLALRPIRAPWLTRRLGLLRRTAATLSPASERFVAVLKRTAKDQPPLHFSVTPNTPATNDERPPEGGRSRARKNQSG